MFPEGSFLFACGAYGFRNIEFCYLACLWVGEKFLEQAIGTEEAV